MKNILDMGLLAVILGSMPAVAAESFLKSAEERQRIEQALPPQALVRPAKTRRLLLFTLNVGYGGHPSIAYANEAFTLMGRKTGAFDTEVSDDPAVFGRESLRRFDAVFFNNTVGNCFTNLELRRNLLEFVTGGGGLLGVHGTSVAFTRWPGAVEDWPEFGYLIGARGANHKDSDEHVWLRLDDAGNPITQVFGNQGFDYRDEFFRPQGTYSRDRVRVLLSIDTGKTDPNKGQPRGDCYRADNDYAAAWIRNYGRGRVFYCTIAHNPYVFWDPKMLQFYLAALQFALGDLPCPTTPSAKLNPAIRAQEKLGWRFGIQAGRPGGATLFENIESASRSGLPYLSSSSSLPLSGPNPKPLDPDLSDGELSEIRLKLESAGLRLVAHQLDVLPADEPAWRKLFEFGRKMGLETFISAAPPKAVDLVEKLCREYGIFFALQTGARKSGQTLDAKGLLRLSENRSQELGACVNLSQWIRARTDPVLAPRSLKSRLLVVQLDSDELRSLTLEKLLTEIHHLQLKPLFLIENSTPSARAGIDLFNARCLRVIEPTTREP